MAAGEKKSGERGSWQEMDERVHGKSSASVPRKGQGGRWERNSQLRLNRPCQFSRDGQRQFKLREVCSLSGRPQCSYTRAEATVRAPLLCSVQAASPVLANRSSDGSHGSPGMGVVRGSGLAHKSRAPAAVRLDCRLGTPQPSCLALSTSWRSRCLLHRDTASSQPCTAIGSLADFAPLGAVTHLFHAAILIVIYPLRASPDTPTEMDL